MRHATHQHSVLPIAAGPLLALAIGLLMLPILGMTGCTTWATYPPIPGAAQVGRPEFEPVPTVMAEAIRFTHERHGETMGMKEEIVFNLPEGTSPNTYDRVIWRLDGVDVPVRWMTQDDEKAIHIKEVRVRANTAQVDVVYPRQDDHHELIMLTMRQQFLNRYRVEGSRLWRIQVSAPRAHYYPPGGRDEWFQRAYPERYEIAAETDNDVPAPEAHVGALPDAEMPD